MPEIGIVLQEPAWPDLVATNRRGNIIHLTNKFEVTGLRGGMASGLASVAFRFDLPDGRSVIAETSLRALYNATQTLALNYGEPWMQMRTESDAVRQLEIAVKHLGQQLVECQRRHGEPAKIDMAAADAEWDAEQKAKNGGRA